MTEKINSLLGYGFPADLASKLYSFGLKIDNLKKRSQKELVDTYDFDKSDASLIKQFIKRQPIAKDIVFELLKNNNFTCCICKGQKGNSYIIHHIKEYSISKDNSYSNLAVLCPNDHDLAHKKGFSLTKNLTEFEIKNAKKAWEKLVKKQNNQSAKLPNTKTQWNALAVKTSNYLYEHLFKVHRGALKWDENTIVIFGNDGYEEEKTQKEIELLRSEIKKYFEIEIASGVSDNNYSWCIFIKSKNLEYYKKVIWKFYPIGSSNNSDQISSADIALSSYYKSYLSNYLL